MAFCNRTYAWSKLLMANPCIYIKLKWRNLSVKINIFQCFRILNKIQQSHAKRNYGKLRLNLIQRHPGNSFWWNLYCSLWIFGRYSNKSYHHHSRLKKSPKRKTNWQSKIFLFSDILFFRFFVFSIILLIKKSKKNCS